MLVRSSCIALVGIAAAEAFAPFALLGAAASQRGHGSAAVSMVSGGESVSLSRRQAMALLSTLPLALGGASPAEAKKAGAARLNAEGQPETKEERGERIRCVGRFHVGLLRVRISEAWGFEVGLGVQSGWGLVLPGKHAAEKRSKYDRGGPWES